MRAMVFLVVGLLMLAGCVTLPIGPSVAVMPAPGKPFEVFVADDADCRLYAAQQTGLAQPQIVEQRELRSMVVGTMLGAAAGAALGAAAGNAGLGASTGAGAGLVMGTAVYGYGAAGGLQWRYDMAYQQCMDAKGNQVPGFPMLAPPPPPTVPPQQ
jgi:Glycine-zipper domain